MKKAITILLLLLFVGSVLAAPMTATSSSNGVTTMASKENGIAGWKKGDINGDGKINAFDIESFTMVVKYARYYRSHHPRMYWAADINDDSMVGIKDIAPFIKLLESQ